MITKEQVKDYVMEHKKEFTIATIAGVVGVFGGVICHKGYISKNYGDLIKAINNFEATPLGVSMVDDTVKFFKKATHSVQAVTPNYEQTIKQAFDEGAVSEYLEKHSGLSPNTIVTGVLVGIKGVEI